MFFLAVVLSVSVTTKPASATITLPISSTDQAVQSLEEAIFPDGIEHVVLKVWGPLSPGTEIRGTKELALTAEAAGYAVFIDDHPTANLFHPVRYAFVHSMTGEITVVDAKSPPLNYEDYEIIDTAIGRILKAAQNRRAEIPEGGHAAKSSNRWAVLMNGGYDSGSNHVRYWNDLSNIYITLNSVYGYPDENIIVLCSDGLDPAVDQSNGQNSDPDLDGDGDDDIMFSCVLSNVDYVFGQLAGTLTENDKLFVFATDHGSSNGGWSTYFNLWNHESLLDSHFADLLDALPQCEIVCTFEPCYSGGFLDDVVVPPGPRVASSACRYDELSWAMPPDYVYDTYVFHWTAAVKGEDAYGVPVDADANHDGIVSMSEAFIYAEANDQSDESPQYDDYPAGIGDAISLWPIGVDPFVVVANTEFEDIGGNDNGAPDPGESITMVVTLANYGATTATNVVGMLTSTDPYLTLTQNISYYPDLEQFGQGEGSPAYAMDISESCPQGQEVSCNLHIEADGYTNNVVVTFIVGDPELEPVGPDAYGYYALDTKDYVVNLVHEWIEIAPAEGGPGTALNCYDDDQTISVDLPFTFRYYGQDYTRISICSNGWMAMGTTGATNYDNTPIPHSDGPPAMISPFWDDLDCGESGEQICTYYDNRQHYFVIEWYNIPHLYTSSQRETFEVILYDPAYWSFGATGDGLILMQYDMVTSPSSATVGIEDHNETVGLQYLFDGTYDYRAEPISGESVILYSLTTVTPDLGVTLTPYDYPIQIPSSGGSFEFNAAVANNEVKSQVFSAWFDATLPSSAVYGPLLGPMFLTLPDGGSVNKDFTENVPEGAPAGTYWYNAHVGIFPSLIWTTDSFDLEKLE
jgi:hypothetical protein